jgi:hypothetical protein
VKAGNDYVFIELFREVCRISFGQSLTEPLSETDSRLVANAIFEKTGLVIGVKSIKNYSHYVLNPRETKKENPSTATLDTLARYVLGAPATDEPSRKRNEGHYPYWFRYRSQTLPEKDLPKIKWRKGPLVGALIGLLVLVAAVLAWRFFRKDSSVTIFKDDFESVEKESLSDNGWTLENKLPSFWRKRDSVAGFLTMYTLVGDNWPGAGESPVTGIKNLLVRPVEADCFTAEIHISDFIPYRNWQQAGILLSEDSSFNAKTIRLSLGYNDFFGGYSKDPEILVQVVGSVAGADQTRPEELAHHVLFTGNPLRDSLIRENLSRVALKIEKKDHHFRFLYSTGRMESFAFHEAAQADLDIHPRYIGIFAIQGMTETEEPLPVMFDYFSLLKLSCDH